MSPHELFYNNVKNITYKGTRAEDTTMIYNNVENINKEAVELNNRYSSSGKSTGINAGATVGYGHKLQTTGNGGSISFNKSNMNTTETIHHNGSFLNVNEVHNNTKNMKLKGFNQEGGTVTGNIKNLELVSVQNTSTTTGSSSGISVGVSSTGMPNSIGLSGSKTNGSRAFVDNQTTFIVGDGSNLTIGKTTNTGSIIGKEGNSKVKINEYVGKDIENHDTLTTTGGSINLQAGKNPIGGIGINQEKRDKEGISRNTVLGDIEIGSTTGSPINRDRSKANEITKDTHNSTNINIEGQTIDYLTNPSRLKEDLDKAKQEIKDIGTAIKESINDRGDDNRNFLGQLGEGRLRTTIDNIAGKRLEKATDQTEIGKAFEDAYKDLGYNAKVIYTDPSKAPQLIDENGNIKSGTAYVGKDGMHTIIINTEDPKNSTRSGIIGMISEEGSHIIGKIEGRQIQTGTEEKGLESTRRATNEYFTDKYKKNDIPIKAKSDGKDYSNIDFGENVGDDRGACLSNGKVLVGCKGREPRKLTPEEQLQNDRITSFIVNLTPVGKYKIAAESIIGEDLVTKQKLSPIERLMPAYSIMKGVINSVNFGVKDNNFKKNEDNKKIDNNSNKNKKPVNKELHEKINNRGEGHYLNLQADKKVGNTTTKYRNFEHISKGEIQVNGKKVEVKGGHSTRNGIIIEEKLQEYPGGSYEAKIKIPDPNNPGKYLSKTNNNGKSTMFPDHWTENRIKVEIDNVLKNPKNFRKNSKWQGATSSGVVIEVIYRERKVITAYPIDPKKISK